MFFIDSNGIRHTFTNHEMLDNWQRANENNLQLLEIEFLKGFHRAFQLQEVYHQNSPPTQEQMEKCIIGNPTH